MEQAATETDRKGKGRTPPPADARTTETTEPSPSPTAALKKAAERTTPKDNTSAPEPWSEEAKSEKIYTAQSKMNLKRSGAPQFVKALVRRRRRRETYAAGHGQALETRASGTSSTRECHTRRPRS